MRRAFSAKVNYAFSLLQGRLVKLLVDDDAFGLVGSEPPLLQSFLGNANPKGCNQYTGPNCAVGGTDTGGEPKERPDREIHHLGVSRVVEDTVKAWKYKGKVEVKDQDGPTFERGGVLWREGGRCNLEWGDVLIHSGTAGESVEAVRRLTAHELMHGSFQRVYKRYEDERRQIMEQEEENVKLYDAANPGADLGTRAGKLDEMGLIRATGELKPEHAKEFPTYARMWQFIEKPTWEDYAKDDGVTPYSEAYWRDQKEGKVTFHIAMHETLAEIAGLHETTGVVNGSKRFKDYYKAVRDEYLVLTGSKKTRRGPGVVRNQAVFVRHDIYLDSKFRPTSPAKAVYVRWWNEDGSNGWGIRAELSANHDAFWLAAAGGPPALTSFLGNANPEGCNQWTGPSCARGEGWVDVVKTGAGRASVEYDPEVTREETAVRAAGWIRAVPESELAKSAARKVVVYDNPEDLLNRLDREGINPDIDEDGVVRGAFDFQTGTLYASVWDGHKESPRTLLHELGHSILGEDEVSAEQWAQTYLHLTANYDAGAAMLEVGDERLKAHVATLQGMIDPADIAKQEGWPHVTVLYGFPDWPEVRDKVERAVAGQRGVEATLGELGLFKNPKYDVLKLAVESPELHRLNARLGLLPHYSTYPDYKPHVTVAYLKPGTGTKYLDLPSMEGLEFRLDKLVYADPKGIQTPFVLNFNPKGCNQYTGPDCADSPGELLPPVPPPSDALMGKIAKLRERAAKNKLNKVMMDFPEGEVLHLKHDQSNQAFYYSHTRDPGVGQSKFYSVVDLHGEPYMLRPSEVITRKAMEGNLRFLSTPPDWRPNETLPEDFYANLSADVLNSNPKGCNQHTGPGCSGVEAAWGLHPDLDPSGPAAKALNRVAGKKAVEAKAAQQGGEAVQLHTPGEVVYRIQSGRIDSEAAYYAGTVVRQGSLGEERVHYAMPLNGHEPEDLRPFAHGNNLVTKRQVRDKLASMAEPPDWRPGGTIPEDFYANFDPGQPRDQLGRFARIGAAAKAAFAKIINLIPRKVRRPVAALVKATLVMQAIGNKAVRAVAKERGLEDEKVRRLSRTVAITDTALGGSRASMIASAMGLTGLALPAAFVPWASVGYLINSTAKAPRAVLRAAKKAVKAAVRNLTARGWKPPPPNPATFVTAADIGQWAWNANPEGCNQYTGPNCSLPSDVSHEQARKLTFAEIKKNPGLLEQPNVAAVAIKRLVGEWVATESPTKSQRTMMQKVLTHTIPGGSLEHLHPGEVTIYRGGTSSKANRARSWSTSRKQAEGFGNVTELKLTRDAPALDLDRVLGGSGKSEYEVVTVNSFAVNAPRYDTEELAESFADYLARHDYSDWSVAVLLSAVEELQGNVPAALQVADEAMRQPVPAFPDADPENDGEVLFGHEWDAAARTWGAEPVQNALFGLLGGRTKTSTPSGDNCGTGAGGFKPGNTCGRGGSSGKEPAPRTRTDTQEFRAWFGESKVVKADGSPQETAGVDVKSDPLGGKPTVVYHGTPRGEFHEFKKEFAGSEGNHYGPGFYFTEDVEAANVFARGGHSSQSKGDKPTVMEFYLKVEKPFDIDKDSIDPSKLPKGERDYVRSTLMQKAFAEDGREAGRQTGADFDAGKVRLGYRELTDAAGVGGLGVSKAAVAEHLKELGHDGLTTLAPDVGTAGKNRFWVVFEPTQVKSTHNRGNFDPNDPNVLNADQEGSCRVGQTAKQTGCLPAKKTGSDITDKEAQAITDYVDWGNSINVRLRLGEKLPKLLRESVEHIDSSMSPTSSDLELFRGTEGDELDGLKAGDSFVDKGYTSASPDKETAGKFTGGSGYLVKIAVPTGSKVLEVPEEAFHPEVVLARGTNFRIKNVDHSAKTAELEVVPSSAKPRVSDEVEDLRAMLKRARSQGERARIRKEIEELTRNFDPGPNVLNAVFPSTHEKQAAFQRWLKKQLAELVDGKNQEALWQAYVEEGLKKGAGRAYDDYRARAKDDPAIKASMEEKLPFYGNQAREQFLRDSFRQPVGIEKVKVLASRAFDELKGVTAAMSLKMSRILADGLVQGQGPKEIAARMADEIKISKTRAELIARTEIIRAHAEGTLMALERMGVTEVTAMVEFSTAGDNDVCPLCRDLNEAIFTIPEARGKIPVHPRCRCTWLPAPFAKKPVPKRGNPRVRAASRSGVAAAARNGAGQKRKKAPEFELVVSELSVNAGWKRYAPGTYRKDYGSGVVIEIGNMTSEIGKRHWNIGVVKKGGGVDWHESAGSRSEAEEWAEVLAKNEFEAKGIDQAVGSCKPGQTEKQTGCRRKPPTANLDLRLTPAMIAFSKKDQA